MKPNLTDEQISNLKAQAKHKQAEDPDDFFSFVCIELIEDITYWKEVARTQHDNAMRWKTR